VKARDLETLFDLGPLDLYLKTPNLKVEDDIHQGQELHVFTIHYHFLENFCKDWGPRLCRTSIQPSPPFHMNDEWKANKMFGE